MKNIIVAVLCTIGCTAAIRPIPPEMVAYPPQTVTVIQPPPSTTSNASLQSIELEAALGRIEAYSMTLIHNTREQKKIFCDNVALRHIKPKHAVELAVFGSKEPSLQAANAAVQTLQAYGKAKVCRGAKKVDRKISAKAQALLGRIRMSLALEDLELDL
jgi:hypothetical protein